MTQFEKELKKEGEELEKLLNQKAAKPVECHIELASAEPLAVAEFSRDVLNQLKSDLKELQSQLRERAASAETEPKK